MKLKGNFYYKKLGENIQNIRKNKNISQEQLANLSDTDRSYLAEIEEGKANPTVKFLYRIARVLKVKVKDFFKGI